VADNMERIRKGKADGGGPKDRLVQLGTKLREQQHLMSVNYPVLWNGRQPKRKRRGAVRNSHVNTKALYKMCVGKREKKCNF